MKAIFNCLSRFNTSTGKSKAIDNATELLWQSVTNIGELCNLSKFFTAKVFLHIVAIQKHSYLLLK